MFENIFRRIRLARTSVVQFNNGQYGVRRRGLFGNSYLDMDSRPRAGHEIRFWRGNDSIRKWCMSYGIEAPIEYRKLYVEHGAYMPEDPKKQKKLKCEVIPDDQLDVERALNKIRQGSIIKESEARDSTVPWGPSQQGQVLAYNNSKPAWATLKTLAKV